MKIETVGVVGAGQMGAGIAHVAARTGMNVLLADVDLERARAGKAAVIARIEKSMARKEAKGAEASVLEAMAAEISDDAVARTEWWRFSSHFAFGGCAAWCVDIASWRATKDSRGECSTCQAEPRFRWAMALTYP